MLKSWIRRGIGRLGYRITKTGPPRSVMDRYPDIEASFFNKIHARCKDYTLTPAARMYALHRALRYVVQSGVAGDIVECGVWRGGSSMVAALTLLELGDTSRKLYLYDTFAGMSEPSAKDLDFAGRPAMKEWAEKEQEDHNEWCFASLKEVEANLRSTGYPVDRVVMVEGKVEETIPGVVPDRIAVLRLDTDWYESTLHELQHLFPRLAERGVLMVDDYGYWKGAREATDEYLGKHATSMLLHRIDATCRVGVKVV